MLSPTTLERWSLFPDPAAPLTAMPSPEVISVPLPALPTSRCTTGFCAAVRAATALVLVLTMLLVLLAAAGGCARRERPLTPRDLTDDESVYVTRILVLERVRAALVDDPVRGSVLGDSLAAAWGDSARTRTLDLAPADPDRAALVHELLLRLLAAEQDSLLRLGGRRAIDAAWPAPADSVPGAGFPGASRGRGDD